MGRTLRQDYPLTYRLITSLNKRTTTCAANLLAAIDLLEHGGRKSVASDRMYRQMLADYRKAAREAAAAIIPQDH